MLPGLLPVTRSILKPEPGVAVLAGLMMLAMAQAAFPSTKAFVVEPLEVSAPGLERDALETPAAVDVVGSAQLQKARQRLALDESLNRVPGVFFQNRYNFAQNLRLSIRGFGARAPFGVRGVRVRVDGIPETLPDGQSQVDTIDLESAERVEVLRGPSSALYGNAAGGVLDVRTRSGDTAPYVQGRATSGSYGLRRTTVMAGGGQGDWRGHASAWHMNYDGYRDQSETEKMMFNGKASAELSPGRRLTAVVTLYDQPKGEDPGGLTREERRADPRQAAPNADRLDAGQAVAQQRLGVIYEDSRALPGTLKLTTFYTARDFEQQLPFPGPSLIGYQRDFYGISSEYRDEQSLGAMPLEWILGAEIREQRDDRERYLVDGAGNRGDRIQDALEKATSSAVYGQLGIKPAPAWRLRLGGRYDRVRFRIDDRRGQGEASGSRAFDEFSVSAGTLWRFHPRHRAYATVGTAFETPTFTEFYDPTQPDEGFDPDLAPQQAVNLELGMKGQLGQRTRYDVAVFRIRTRDEVVQVDSEPDRFANVGETRRDGVELGIEHFLDHGLSLTGAYTWSDFRFRDDQGTNSRTGNRLPGLPEHNLFLELAWRQGGWFAAIDGLAVSEVYADDANREEVAGYAVLNARVARTLQMKASEFELSAGVNNLADREYNSNVRINAAADRFFEPAPGRNYYVGARLRF